jgi:hypothetical protein
MIYIILTIVVVLVILAVALSHELHVTGCQGDCDQGRKPCNCKGNKQ